MMRSSGKNLARAASALATCVLFASRLAVAAESGPVRPTLPTVRTLEGKPLDFVAPKGGATVVLFYSSECPISNEYSPKIRTIVSALPKQARVVGVCVDYDLTDAELARHAKEHDLPFPATRDRDGRLAAKFGAKVTPEAVVLDDAGAIRYRGRIDDRYAARGKRKPESTTTDLKDAVLAIMSHREPATPWPPAVGCRLSGNH